MKRSRSSGAAATMLFSLPSFKGSSASRDLTHDRVYFNYLLTEMINALIRKEIHASFDLF